MDGGFPPIRLGTCDDAQSSMSKKKNAEKKRRRAFSTAVPSMIASRSRRQPSANQEWESASLTEKSRSSVLNAVSF